MLKGVQGKMKLYGIVTQKHMKIYNTLAKVSIESDSEYLNIVIWWSIN